MRMCSFCCAQRRLVCAVAAASLGNRIAVHVAVLLLLARVGERREEHTALRKLLLVLRHLQVRIASPSHGHSAALPCLAAEYAEYGMGRGCLSCHER
jgi:hypothetical protein